MTAHISVSLASVYVHLVPPEKDILQERPVLGIEPGFQLEARGIDANLGDKLLA